MSSAFRFCWYVLRSIPFINFSLASGSFPVSLSLFYIAVRKLETVLQLTSKQLREQRHYHLPWLACYASSKATQNCICFLFATASHCWLMLSLWSTTPPISLSAVLLPRQLSAILCLSIWFCFPKYEHYICLDEFHITPDLLRLVCVFLQEGPRSWNLLHLVEGDVRWS